MDSIRIEVGVPLQGTVRVSGAKNAALPILYHIDRGDERIERELAGVGANIVRVPGHG